MKRIYLLFLFLTPIHLNAGNGENPLEGIDDYILRGMEQWKIPGLAVAVVKNDSVLYMNGFGERKLGKPDRVDENTLFGIASLTKAFTTTAIAMLVEEGKLQWDDPVINYLPDFKLHDPWVTKEITIRDLLTHNSGLGRLIGNRLQFMTHRPRDELIYRLRYLEPERSFRSGYLYNNMLYLVAGEIIPAVTGKSWDDFIKERIFLPLGMNRSNTGSSFIHENENAAYPHQEIDGEVRVIPRRNFDNAAPAASINSNASDLIKWMKLHLGTPGEYNGNILLSPSSVKELHSPQTPLSSTNPAEEFAAYGIGWGIRLYHGKIISRHGGATDGMYSFILLLHEKNLGVVVLLNVFSDFMYALANDIVDRFIDAPDKDWNEEFYRAYQRKYDREQAARDSIHEARITGTDPSLPLENYEGRFYDSLYAEADVKYGGEKLSVTFWEDTTLVVELEHWHYDKFRGIWKNPAQREKFLWFEVDEGGNVVALNVEFNLRPDLLQVGAYPSSYTRTVRYLRME